jgi:RNA polymerase sigma-70 factor (ECF subfamily)
MKMEKSDEEIIERVLAGYKEDYGILIRRYQRQVFNLMYRYSRTESDAADLSQDVFVRAFEKLDTFGTEQRFFPWLYTLALNRARDWARKNRRKEASRILWPEQMVYPGRDGSGQEGRLQKREDLRRLQEAIARLPDRTREILLLRYHEECSVRETSRVFGISESAVKMRTSRGLRQLQEIMEKNNS